MQRYQGSSALPGARFLHDNYQDMRSVFRAVHQGKMSPFAFYKCVSQLAVIHELVWGRQPVINQSEEPVPQFVPNFMALFYQQMPRNEASQNVEQKHPIN